MIHIRPTQITDANSLPEIENSAGERFRSWPELAWVADGDDVSVETHLKYIQQGTSWVAETDQQLVGFLCAEMLSGNLHIWEFSVRREWQRQGIGRSLFNTALAYAQNHNLRYITLTTFRTVPWNEPFYHALGFETVEQENLPLYLKQILIAEIEHGLPGEMRCAMRRLL